MQHKVPQMGSQIGSQEGMNGLMLPTSKLMNKAFAATLVDVRVDLLTLVLISEQRGAA
jgi:hypothetical protein